MCRRGVLTDAVGGLGQNQWITGASRGNPKPRLGVGESLVSLENGAVPNVD